MYSIRISALAAGALLLAGCGSEQKRPESAKAEAPAVRIRTVQAESAAMPVVYQATGTVRARSSAVLSARVMGYLKEVRVQAGDTVTAGQVIAVVDAREIEAATRQAAAALNEAKMAMPEVQNAIAAAKAQLALAESTYKRMKPLFDDKSITPQEFDEVSARRQMAEANLAMAQAKRGQLEARIQQASEAVSQAETQRGYLTVAAPFSGVVVERKAEPGMLASPGQPIAIIEQAGAYRLEAAIEEARLKEIRAGTPATVRLDAIDQEFKSVVNEIVPALEPGSRTFTAKINLPAGPMVRSGMFGRAAFRLGEKQAVQVPERAVRSIGQLEQVYVVDQGVARARLVTTGLRVGGRVEILSGLSGGELLAADTPADLSDGSRVEVSR